MTTILENQVANINHITKKQQQEICEVRHLSENIIQINKKVYVDGQIMNWFELLQSIAYEKPDAFLKKYVPTNICLDDDGTKMNQEFLTWLRNLIELKDESMMPSFFTLSDKEKKLIKKADTCEYHNQWFDLFVLYRDIFKK